MLSPEKLYIGVRYYLQEMAADAQRAFDGYLDTLRDQRFEAAASEAKKMERAPRAFNQAL